MFYLFKNTLAPGEWRKLWRRLHMRQLLCLELAPGALRYLIFGNSAWRKGYSRIYNLEGGRSPVASPQQNAPRAPRRARRLDTSKQQHSRACRPVIIVLKVVKICPKNWYNNIKLLFGDDLVHCLNKQKGDVDFPGPQQYSYVNLRRWLYEDFKPTA